MVLRSVHLPKALNPMALRLAGGKYQREVTPVESKE